ncbi:YkgJ family cysteine cluster protein [Natrialbaceae archaeon A-arb3/5]
MEVNCAGCAGCCLDWTPLLDERADHHNRAVRPFDSSRSATGREPIDGDPNFVPLTRDEVRAFLERGLAAALTPRFWTARDDDSGVEIDGRILAAVAGRPVFFVGLRKPPKPVAPFGREKATWLPSCVFLDPTTLQCRIHDREFVPDECRAYPAYNLELDQETECERVEAAFGGDRLLDDGVDERDGPLLGSQAIGAKLFCHPRPATLEGTIDRVETGDLRPEDRAELLAVASASSPGTLAISDHHYERGKRTALESLRADESPPSETDDEPNGEPDGESWVGPAIREWNRLRSTDDGTVPPPSIAATVEDERGAPETPGWDALETD